MASLFNTRISDTYVGLIKSLDNSAISATLKQLSDGSGNSLGIYVNTSGDFKVNGILEWASLKDTGEDITITKFVDEADGIGNNDNDTTIPTSAAVKDYVDTQITAEDLDFAGDTGSGSVDLDSQVLTVSGTANEIETSASGQTLTIGLPSSISVNLVGNVTGDVTGDLTGNVTATSILADGVTATTQASNDNSTKVATTAYVDAQVTAEDLDFSGDSGSGSVDLDSQTFSIIGTTNEIETSATGQQLQIGLPSTISVNVTGNLTGNVTGDVTGDVTGNLTGNVTGDLTGSILTASQTNITSVGTLTSLSVSGNATISSDLILSDYGSGTHTGTATQRLGVDSSGNVIEIPIGAGAVDGSGTANTVTMWTPDSNTIGDAPITISGNNSTFAGDVGIGGSPTSDTLTLTSKYLLLSDSQTKLGDNGIIGGGSADGNSRLEYFTGKSLLITQSGTERMRLDSSGQLGLGVTSMGGTFHTAITPTPSSTTVNETADYTDSFIISADGSSSLGDRIPLIFNVGDSTFPSISSVIEAGRYGSGWDTYLSFYINGITSGSEGTDAIQEMMRINKTGVGIRTDSPNIYSLTDATNILSVQATGTNKGGIIDISASGTGYSGINLGNETIRRGGIYTLDGSNLVFYTNATDSGTSLSERLRITSGGLVGVNHSSPVTFLDVRGNSTALPATSGTTVSDGTRFRIGSTTASTLSAVLDFGLGTSSRAWIQSTSVGDLSDTKTLLLNPNGGDIGIGHDSPTNSLNYNTLDIRGTSGAQIILGRTAMDFFLYSTSTSSHLGSSTGQDLIFHTNSNGGNNERMRITSGGLVGIGTTTPTGKLNIEGAGNHLHLRANTASAGKYWNFDVTANNQLFIITDDGTGMNIKNTGEVGIGTDSPANALHIKKEGYQLKLEDGNTTNTAEILASNNTMGFFSDRADAIADSDMLWSIDNSEKMRLNSTGLGIGTSSPIVPVHIVGTAVNNPSNGNGGYEVMQIFDDTAFTDGVGGGIGFGGNFTSSNSTIFSEIRGIKENNTDSNYAGALLFSTRANGANITERMRIASDGSVGIGSTSPSGKLEVHTGSSFAYFTRTAGDNGSTGTAIALGADSTKTRLYSYGTAMTFFTGAVGGTATERMRITSDSNPTLRLGVSGTGTSIFEMKSASAGSSVIDAEQYLQIKTSGSERMRIDSSGNVGILTTSMLNTGNDRGSLTIGGSVAGTLNIGNGSINFGIYSTSAETSIYSLEDMKFGVGSSFPERMRVLSGGQVCIGTTSTTVSSSVVSAVFGSGSDATLKLGGHSGTHTMIQFLHTGTVVGSVSSTTVATAYNTSSDYRLKEDLQDFNALDIASKIKMYDFKWKADDT